MKNRENIRRKEILGFQTDDRAVFTRPVNRWPTISVLVDLNPKVNRPEEWSTNGVVPGKKNTNTEESLLKKSYILGKIFEIAPQAGRFFVWFRALTATPRGSYKGKGKARGKEFRNKRRPFICSKRANHSKKGEKVNWEKKGGGGGDKS